MVCERTELLVAGKTARVLVKTGGSVLVGHVGKMEAGCRWRRGSGLLPVGNVYANQFSGIRLGSSGQ